MGKNSHVLFNTIAPFYDLFYKRQRNYYEKIIDNIVNDIDLKIYKTVLDVGCGTGALCAVLNSKGLTVTGIDPAVKMLELAKGKSENNRITFLHANVLEGLPFEDKAFDISIASYVAHGLKQTERKKMYIEMSRITKEKVIIYDYNKNRSLLTSIVEWIEHGDYFHFINVAQRGMEECMSDMNECFSDVRVINVGARAAWYICTPT